MLIKNRNARQFFRLVQNSLKNNWDSKSLADLPGLPANLHESNVSLHEPPPVFVSSLDDASFREMASFFLPCGEGDTPAQTPTRKRASKQPRRSSRFTDNNTSETSVVDDDFLHIDKKPKGE